MMDKSTVIRMDRLQLAYPQASKLLFHDLNVHIVQGEKVLLLGPSGCGKSTLLQVMAGLVPKAINLPMQANELVTPERFGFVFQDPDSQFCMPYVDEELGFVLENMGVPREAMLGKMNELLDLVGLRLSTNHTSIQTLSQGMKQRLAIACALAPMTDTLFLDEPTALLDPEGTEQVWKTIRETCGEQTVLIVEHRISEVLPFIDRILLFDDAGSIIADSTPTIIFQNHLDKINNYGIWHPDSWKEFLNEYPLATRKIGDSIQLALNEWTLLRKKRVVLEAKDAQVNQGEWICVTGKNGAGKTTLLYGLMNLLKANGSYTVNGDQVKRKQSLVDKIGFVFQNPEYQFVTDSVMEELTIGIPLEEAEKEARALEVLEQFRLIEKKDEHPYKLSIGQKRRLSVATAFMVPKSILLLDEPTFGQDASNTFQLLRLLEQFRLQGGVVIMVTHDREIVQHFATQEWKIEAASLKEAVSRHEGGKSNGISVERYMA